MKCTRHKDRNCFFGEERCQACQDRVDQFFFGVIRRYVENLPAR